MALLELGPLAVQISGSVGGTTFARNKGGQYARSRIKGVNPQSARQTAVRAAFGDLAQRWSNTLTDAQRAAWELYADNVPLINRLGDPRTLSGLNMYVRTNTVQLDTGGTRLDDAPVNFTVGPTITPTYANTPAADTIGVTDLGSYDPDTDGAIRLLVTMGRPQNAGVAFYASPFTKLLGVDIPTTATLPIAQTAAPFPFSAGQRVFLRAIPITSDGRLGVPVISDFLAA